MKVLLVGSRHVILPAASYAAVQFGEPGGPMPVAASRCALSPVV
jgi:hypothetical protein